MQFSAPLKSNSKKIMLLGSGELGKEVVIEAQRLGLETIAVDKYANAPAHQVAHRSYVVDMQNKEALLEIIYRMSSSGHGQSVARSEADIPKSWEMAKEARGDASELIVEAFIDFDYEITMLTARNGKETVFCEPIGHEQRDGDYVFSWQPMQMSEVAKQKAQQIAKEITDGLGGQGLFGVELFVKGDEVYFSEVSPRPHDTGMVTLITQSQSEFALHLRAVLGLPLGFTFYGDGASAAFKSEVHNYAPVVNVDESLFSDNSYVRVFGKPEAHKGRRLAVALVYDQVDAALEKARELITKVKDN
ncbi:MAG: phosphoribosylglycinamide formyltransferase 2 [Campylobacterales bacterium]|nr:phosphoribosylglycinamide formyltransferase 2 [Campylobacterales bacterium]